MRFARSTLLERLGESGGRTGVVLLEAPHGFGKSWVARRIVAPGSPRAKGDVSGLDALGDGSAQALLIDDAHLLSAADVDRLALFIEDYGDGVQLVVAGRLLPGELLDAARLIDATIVDATGLSISAAEVVEAGSWFDLERAEHLTEAAQGSVRLLAAALDQIARDPALDAVALVQRLERADATGALEHLAPADVECLGLLARSPQVDRYVLDRLGGAGFAERIVAAGVPLRRGVTGGIELGTPVAYRTPVVDAASATRFAEALAGRGHAIEAATLLIDADAHDRAGELLASMPDSALDTTEPRSLLALLARLASLVERDAALLLLRALAYRRAGQQDRSGRDLDRAFALTPEHEGRLRRRLLVEQAHRLWTEGDAAGAEGAARGALRDIGPGEDTTLASAHVVLAEVSSSDETRDGLQRAADEYRTAIDAWEGCGELARARRCAFNLAVAVLVPLGRFDEALGQFQRLLAATDLSDAERTWITALEGFTLWNANRLDAAEGRFARVADIGQLRDDPRLIAMAAWGRAVVAARRDDVPAALRWFGVAENTALGPADDLLGVPFLCDITTYLGGLGELEVAGRYLAKARGRGALYPNAVALAEFVYNARLGRLGDVDAQLAATPPLDWWRVKLVAALALARRGDLAAARRWYDEAKRELIMLGYTNFAALGERRVDEELQALLVGAPVLAAMAAGSEGETAEAASGRRLAVIGGPMKLQGPEGLEAVPPGNPQRLLGVIAAYGGSASFDQLSEAIWPGEDIETSRTRLRNVLLRLRRGVGEVVVRTASGVRLAADVTCDLHDFERMAGDALASSRSDPDLAGHLASDAVELVNGPIFADFEYEEWAETARRQVEQQLLGMLDFLSVQSEDAGDLPLAQSYAERALRVDRYSDSRYVRLAELLTMQGRNAAAVAVLQDGAEAAREMGGSLPAAVSSRRDELMKRAATS